MKRVIDLVGALILSLILAPMLAVLAFLVLIHFGRPILFRQRRIGWRERPFNLYKFRTMIDAVDPFGNVLPDEERLTAFGRWLRSWSLDELPQIWNVMRGEMSFIGPRPLLPEYLPYYSLRHRCRHDVRPGLSGWAQVQGRNAISWERRLDLDLEYVSRQGPTLDFRIALLTVRKLLLREGVSQAGHATMEKFRGVESGG